MSPPPPAWPQPAPTPLSCPARSTSRVRHAPPVFLLFLLLASPAFATGLLDNRPSATLGAASLANNADFLPVHEAFKLSLVQADAQTVKLRFVATEGYYLYRHRFQFRTEPADIALGTPNIPKGEAKHDEFFGDVEVYHGVLDIGCRAPTREPSPCWWATRAVPTKACATHRKPHA